MVSYLLADIDWLPGNDLLWIAGIGVAIAALAFLLGTRFVGRQPVLDGPQPSAEPASDPFDAGASSSERRQAFRRKGSSITVQLSDLEPNAEKHPGWVMDRSVNGIGLWSEKKVSVGTQLKVRPDNAPAMTPWVEVEVRSCIEYEGGWRFCCAFLKSPPYTVLLLFG